MRQLSRLESLLFLLGGIMMVTGAGLYVFFFQRGIVSWVMLVGAVLFAAMQIRQKYLGQSLTIRRLRKIIIAANVFFVVAGLIMVESEHGILQPYFVKDISSQLTYIRVFQNNWVVAMLIGAVLEVYSTHRIDHELKKEDKR